jgi:hypothetical protein
MTSFDQQVGSHEICVDIGDTPILLRTSDPRFRELIAERYIGFVSDLGPAESTFDIDLLPQPHFPLEGDESVELEPNENDDDVPLIVKHEHGQWRLHRGDFHAQWDSATREGRIVQAPTPYAIDTVLRIVHSLIQADRGGFLLHGASAIRNGKAFLFSGISGAGKTTISRLAPPDTTVLTDEISYVRFHGSSYRACGTPFAGELARVGENAQAPIEHLFFLAKGPENRIESMRPSDALRMLLRNILFFADDSTLVESVFRSACQFLERVPVSRLTFYPDVHVWDLIG